MDKDTTVESIFQQRPKVGVIVALYKDDAFIANSLTASVLHNKAPLDEQLNSGIYAVVKPDHLYAYSSEQDALTSRAFFYGDWWNEGYLPEDLCREWDITPLYRRSLWVVSIDADAKMHARTVRLDTHQAINAQLIEQHLTKAYLCSTRAEAESLASKWNNVITDTFRTRR